MKRSSIFSIYLSIFLLMTVLGYCFDSYLGIWRQAIVGIILLGIGVFLRAKFSLRTENRKVVSKSGISVGVISSVVLAGGVLLAIALRLFFANLFSIGLIPNSDVTLFVRIIATVVFPSVCALCLAFYVIPSLLPVSSCICRILCTGIVFLPFCTHVVYLPSAFVLGVIYVLCDVQLTGNIGVEIFACNFALMFYDTMSISVGRVDYYLSRSMAVSFLLLAVSVCGILAYLSFRVLRDRKFKIAECLTVLLVSLIVFIVAIAI